MGRLRDRWINLGVAAGAGGGAVDQRGGAHAGAGVLGGQPHQAQIEIVFITAGIPAEN
jgi:hypothetical protein